MTTISIAMIAHNEELNVPRALRSCLWADEIVFVDCGSTDGTAAAARAFPVKYFSRPNSTAVYVNKQFALEQASSDWVFILDADEEVPADLAAELRAAVAAPGAPAAFKIPRRNHYYGRWLRFGGKYPDSQLRLFRRGSARYLPLPVHERLEVDGRVARLSRPFDHYPCVSPEYFARKREFYGKMLAESYALKRKNRVLILLRPFTLFVTNFIMKFGFLDGAAGVRTAAMDFRNVMTAALVYFRRGRG